MIRQWKTVVYQTEIINEHDRVERDLIFTRVR